ncbi:MAG TPA: hypothetical protein VMH86_17190 [Rhizomicrobium sp.]|nr:hypothetical protein [Rhizomicrobium sp.]
MTLPGSDGGPSPQTAPRKQLRPFAKPPSTAVYSIIVSTAALLGTLFNFWYSNWRSADIEVQEGKTASIAHNLNGALDIYVPVVFWNHGARPDVVTDTELSLKYLPTGREIPLKPFSYYINEGSSTKFGDDPVPEIVAGQQIVRRNIVFQSTLSDAARFGDLKAGTYEMVLSYHLMNSERIHRLSSTHFKLGDDAVDYLSQPYGSRGAAVWPFWIDR